MNRPFWSFRSASSDNLCDSIEPLLSLYADGLASPAETRRIETHLPECENCRAALSWMKATRTVLSSRPVAVPPPDLHSRIALAIAASSPVTLRPARVFTLRTAYAAAASVTALGIALSYPLWHTPSEVAVKHPAKPSVLAAAPAVKPHLVPKTSTRPLVASNSAQSTAVKHSVIARKIVPSVVTVPEHIAANALPTKLPAVPTIITKAPAHSALPTQKIASREIMPTEKHSIEKHSPLPTVKAVGPRLPDTLKVARIIKEPIHIPLDIQPKVTPDPVVQTASAHQPPAEYDNPLGGLQAQLREKNARVRDVALTAFSAPARGSFHEAMRGIQEIGNTDQTAIISTVHGNQ